MAFIPYTDLNDIPPEDPALKMSDKQKAIAVIWDFDGTLVDTGRKNLNVTLELIKLIKPDRSPDSYSALSNLDKYLDAARRSVNWRDFYRKEFSLTSEETDLAGKLWTEFQLRDNTEIFFFQGIRKVLKTLQYLPHAIVSQNSRDNILQLLNRAELGQYFKEVIGYEEVDIKLQKPHPDGLLKCIEQTIGSQPGIVYYIGDHETDIVCASRADKILKESNITVRSIAAFYHFELNPKEWNIQPDHIALQEEDIIKIVIND